MREITDEELIGILNTVSTWGKVVPPEGIIIPHPLGQLKITLEHLAESTEVTLESESDYWKGGLIHCGWWKDNVKAMVIMEGKKVSFTIKQTLNYCPFVAKIVKGAEPEIFKKAYEEAIIKPTREELRKWAEREGLTYLLE
jgi:hypothetical protein